MWKRSLSNYRFRYTLILSNGNDKLCTNLDSLHIYNVPIQQEDSLNHFHKRILSTFKKLIKFESYSSDQLSRDNINTLAEYFSNAVNI